MQHTDVRELAHRFIRALTEFEQEGGNALDALVDLFAEDANVVNPALELAHERRVGRDEIRRFWTTYRDVLGTARSSFREVTTNQRAAGLFWTTRATGGHDARASSLIEYGGATLLVFDEQGLVSSFRAYFDQRELAERHSHRAPISLSAR